MSPRRPVQDGSFRSPVGSRAAWPAPPRWAVWSLVCLFVFLAGAFSVGRAQPAGSIGADYSACIVGGGNYTATVDAAARANNDVHDVAEIEEILQDIFFCSLERGAADILPIGQGMMGPLMVIMTVWFGVGVMFGGFDPGAVLGFIFRIGFAVMLLNNYYYATPTDTPFGVNQGAVWTIAWQGVQFSRETMFDARAIVDTASRAASRQHETEDIRGIVANATDPTGDISVDLQATAEANERGGFARWWAGPMKLMQHAFLSLVGLGWLLFLKIIGWIVYAQYLWGFIGLSVLGILGPLFIPFAIVPQLDFLFWGWIKALLNVTIYMMTAAVMYVVAAMLLIDPLRTIAAEKAQTHPESLGDFVLAVVGITLPYAPVALMVVMASLQVGGVAGALLSGGNMPAAGLSGRVWSAATTAFIPSDRRAAMRAFSQRWGEIPAAYREGRDQASLPRGAPPPSGAGAAGGPAAATTAESARQALDDFAGRAGGRRRTLDDFRAYLDEQGASGGGGGSRRPDRWGQPRRWNRRHGGGASDGEA